MCGFDNDSDSSTEVEFYKAGNILMSFVSIHEGMTEIISSLFA